MQIYVLVTPTKALKPEAMAKLEAGIEKVLNASKLVYLNADSDVFLFQGKKYGVIEKWSALDTSTQLPVTAGRKRLLEVGDIVYLLEEIA